MQFLHSSDSKKLEGFQNLQGFHLKSGAEECENAIFAQGEGALANLTLPHAEDAKCKNEIFALRC